MSNRSIATIAAAICAGTLSAQYLTDLILPDIPPDPPKATTQAATQPQTTQPAQTEPQREVVTGAPYSVPFEEVAPPAKPEEIATDAPHGALSDEQEKAADDKFG